MKPYCIVTDPKRCINCKACQIQCKVWNKLENSESLGTHLHLGPYMVEGKAVLRTQFLPCLQCHDPWCVRACPTGAMHKDSDGIVRVNQRLCVGCKGCLVACPWSIPRWHAASGTIRKCDYCTDRLQAGLEPACVTTCPTKALKFTNDPQQCASVYALQAAAR